MVEAHAALVRLSRIPLYRRLIALALFLALVIGFRHLALVGVTFIVLARALGFLGSYLGLRFGRDERVGVLAILLILGGLLGAVIWGTFHQGSRYIEQIQALRSGRPLTELFAELQEQVMGRLPSWLPLDDLKEKVPDLVQPALGYLRATGRGLLQLLLGLILAVIYLLDRHPVDVMLHGVQHESLPGVLRRYFGFLGEAIVLTITLQVVVAVVNTLLTLPILVVLRLPHLLGFTLLIFFSSLVPVVGNLVSGAALIAASYVYKGPWAVVFFVLTTFVLHKIEAYYLNPRLAARHVRLPSFVLIISLILFEHAFGLVGLFLSFPALYVGLNILADLRKASAALPVEAVPVAAVVPVAQPDPADKHAGRPTGKHDPQPGAVPQYGPVLVERADPLAPTPTASPIIDPTAPTPSAVVPLQIELPGELLPVPKPSGRPVEEAAERPSHPSGHKADAKAADRPSPSGKRKRR
jgi:predicted PurR-regulated permease PerM